MRNRSPVSGARIIQCHNIEPKVPAMIRSLMNLQETIAKALLVGP
jgi:L-rhamnose isomerase/sugar isomerase